MAFAFEDLIESLRASRSNFHRHLSGLKDDQWDWKPFPECKSIRETLIHLLVDDRAALGAFGSEDEPDYEGLVNAATAEAGNDITRLHSLLEASFETLIAELTSRYADKPLDTEISVFGSPRKLGVAIPYFSSEDYYHTGQVSFIRMAGDPSWNYYEAIYGFGE